MNQRPSVGLSLMDRLIGEDAPTVTHVRQGLKRDLEDLLNTRQRVTSWPSILTELEKSVLAYGVFDLTTANFSTEAQRAAVVERIGDAVRRAEPRLSQLRISPLTNSDPSDRSLRVRIEAEIIVDSEAEPVQFSTIIDPLGQSVSITDQS